MERDPHDLLDEDTADRMLGGVVSAADAPPGYAPVAELLAAVRGDFESEVRLPAGAGQPRRRRHGMRMAVLLAAAALVLAAGASYADVLPVSTAGIRHAVNTMLEQTPAPPVPAGGTRWQTRYAPGAEPASFAGSCRPVRSLSQGTLQLVCADAGSSEVVQYQFAVRGARAGVPTFSVETGPTSSGLVSTSIGRVANGRLMLTVRVRGKGVVDIRSVSIGFYGRG